MFEASTEFWWGLLVGFAALLILAGGILTITLLYRRKIIKKDKKFGLLFNRVFDALLILDTNGKIIETNDSACNLLKYKKEEILGMPFLDICSTQDPTAVQFAINNVRLSGTVYWGEKTLLSTDGKTVFVDSAAICVEHNNTHCVMICFRDISKRKQIEDALRESEERYRAIWECSPVGICLTDKNGVYRYVNPAYCKIYGYLEEELIGHRYFDIIMKPDDIEAQRRHYYQLFENGNIIEVGETKFYKKDGEPIWVQFTGDFVRKDKVPQYLMAVNVDITEQKIIQQALDKEKQILHEKNAALKEILSYLKEEKAKIRDEFSSIINRILLPSLRNLINGDGTVNKTYYELFEKNLGELAEFNAGIRHTFTTLSVREIEICNLIKSGATSKDISKTLNLSLLTINKHRQRIRGKLTISNKNINLTSYLRNPAKYGVG